MDNVKVVLTLLGILVGLPIAILLIRDRLTRPSRKRMEEASRQFLERLKNPDLAAMEKHFGTSLPQCLKDLYADRAELLRADFLVAPTHDTPADERHYIAYYQPADAQAVKDAWNGLERYFTFADEGCGNGYLIDPKEADPAVHFHDHETGELTRICSRLSEFLRWPKFDTA